MQSGGREVAGRQLVFDHVTAGHMEAAVSELTRLYTRGPLDGDPALDFRLKVQRRGQMIRCGGVWLAGYPPFGIQKRSQILRCLHFAPSFIIF